MDGHVEVFESLPYRPFAKQPSVRHYVDVEQGAEKELDLKT